MNVCKKEEKKKRKREKEIALLSSKSGRTDFYLRLNYKLRKKDEEREK
jgi:hypothetical protein